MIKAPKAIQPSPKREPRALETEHSELPVLCRMTTICGALSLPARSIATTRSVKLVNEVTVSELNPTWTTSKFGSMAVAGNTTPRGSVPDSSEMR